MTVLENLIGGEWSAPAVELDGYVCNANTGERLLRQRGSNAEQVDAAVSAASDVHQRRSWSAVPAAERASILEAVAGEFAGRAMDIAEIDAMTTGVPIRYTSILARLCAAAFRSGATLATESPIIREGGNFEVARLPLGPAGIVAPWNAPAGIACHKLASAMAAGCPVVFKPSEWTPHSANIIADVLLAAGVPENVFQLVHGDGATGAALVGDPRIAAVSFTGGLAGGRAVAETCASQIKPAQLELGGNNPMIVLDSADVETVVDGIVAGLTTLNGQWCRALGRLLLHDSLYDAVMARVAERLDALLIGDSTDPATEMGPLVHEAHRDSVAGSIARHEDGGATVHRYGRLPDLSGWFLQPTLVADADDIAVLDEVFGPVATVHRFVDTADAIEFANSAPYGLAAYVFGETDAAVDVAHYLEAGMVKINAVTLFSPHPDLPRPAWKQSGLGDEGTRETFEFFRGSRVIGVPGGAA